MTRHRTAAILASCLAVALSAAAARDGETARVWDVRIDGARAIPDSAIDAVRRALVAASADPRCPLRLASRDEQPELIVTLTITRWRATTAPGGRPVLDLATGRERPGRARTIEAGYHLRIAAPGRERPLVDRERRTRQTAASTGNPYHDDPESEAERRLLEWIAADVERHLCRARKALSRASTSR